MPIPASSLPSLILLVRHGATEWSTSGQHTGRTDLPLTALGEDQARAAAKVIDHWLDGVVPVVYTSPLQRASRTAALALPAHPDEVVTADVDTEYVQ